jgi:hypothetical protein
MIDLNDALDQKIQILNSGNMLLKKAAELFGKGFSPSNLSKSQMNAVGELIENASSFRDARENTVKFLTKQLDKLKDKAERRGDISSWLVPAKDDSGKSLGEFLIRWIAEGLYSPETQAGGDGLRLELLRRFWVYLYGHYSYEKTTGKAMQIEEVVDHEHFLRP